MGDTSGSAIHAGRAAHAYPLDHEVAPREAQPDPAPRRERLRGQGSRKRGQGVGEARHVPHAPVLGARPELEQAAEGLTLPLPERLPAVQPVAHHRAAAVSPLGLGHADEHSALAHALCARRSPRSGPRAPAPPSPPWRIAPRSTARATPRRRRGPHPPMQAGVHELRGTGRPGGYPAICVRCRLVADPRPYSPRARLRMKSAAPRATMRRSRRRVLATPSTRARSPARPTLPSPSTALSTT